MYNIKAIPPSSRFRLQQELRGCRKSEQTYKTSNEPEEKTLQMVNTLRDLDTLRDLETGVLAEVPVGGEGAHRRDQQLPRSPPAEPQPRNN